ncbi:MAG TPA: ABC transporter ATP-binding protein [Coriobacteriia bacterium]|nr:ABC transporter ATP-binding protein [Coriobacteriia bacterium]
MSDLLDIVDVSISFTRYEAGLRRRTLRVINGLSVDVRRGEVLAVIGSSGSGKSLLAHAVLGILPGNAHLSGSMRFVGEELTPERQRRARGREIALVPQAVTSLDPLMRVGPQVRWGAPVNGNGSQAEAQRRVFARYGLTPEVERSFPAQLSGGMTRRVLLSTAVVSGASLIIADEPTPGLDPEALAETMRHLRELADENKGVMLITHDIETAVTIADRIAVFYAGTAVEVCPAHDFLPDGAALRHPYTRALWRALPRNGLAPVAGAQPSYDDLPDGCAFRARCDRATSACAATRPALRSVRGGMVACIHAA